MLLTDQSGIRFGDRRRYGGSNAGPLHALNTSAMDRGFTNGDVGQYARVK
ncbi:hypothetical protein BN873_230019 [Candidatus Competibacter denitrificans Run_A_D11]|uniref:Uncharacterized protein n=1 Tax=Candidatus Competibacter denitrificans Run_A_D11 TaxID=1400863 RepID=W6M5V6_9GAMM|nr:hypothetical protein BN873_230019 [Candidatus Competibacter denitrificans Run_A_D11]